MRHILIQNSSLFAPQPRGIRSDACALEQEGRMGKNSAISDCFQPRILFLFYPCSRVFTCDCLFNFHLYARSFFILYPYGASNVGFMGRADGQCRDTVTAYKYIIVAAWGTAKVSALPGEEWVQQDNLVIPGYLQLLLGCVFNLFRFTYGGEIWSQRLTQLSFVWFLCVVPGNRGTEICAFECPVYGTRAPPVLQSFIYLLSSWTQKGNEVCNV